MSYKRTKKSHQQKGHKRPKETHKQTLERLASKAMRDNGFRDTFSPKVYAELQATTEPVIDESIEDLRGLLWCSIDNDDSEDLDQLTASEMLPSGHTRLLVAVADVDALVPLHSAIDKHAEHNTTSVYTAGGIFSMLPEELSTDKTSLNPGEDRAAMIMDMEVDSEGKVVSEKVYLGMVHNYAKLAYSSIGAWLGEDGEVPAALAENKELQAAIIDQVTASQRLKERRTRQGALHLETIEGRPVFTDEMVTDLEIQKSNVATELIEECMVAANGAVARFLFANKVPSIRRIVRIPKRWDNIVELAATHGVSLPDTPDSKALDKFLTASKEADPLRFPDLSLSVVKLLGPGEYIVEYPGGSTEGHFGLAVQDYAHSTAPNRRFPDLIGHRMVKAVLAKKPMPYSKDELNRLAEHCTLMEDNAKKVERQIEKAADALLLESKIGQVFEAVITGASERGTWVRLLDFPVEGMLMRPRGERVGNRLKVRLVSVKVERGFIDFERQK